MRELSLHVLDLLENSLRAGATRVTLTVSEDRVADRLCISVHDDGHGMPEEMARRVFDPFLTTRTTRRVGMGLSLLQAAAERTGGSAWVRSAPGDTEVRAEFGLSHVDRAPLGDLVGTAITFMAMPGAPALSLSYSVGETEFAFDSAEAVEIAGHPLTTMDLSGWVQEYLVAGIQAVNQSES